MDDDHGAEWPAGGREEILRQAWRDEPEAGFQPGRVRFAITTHVIQVRAVLEDLDIHTEANAFNQPLFQLGDTFEMFFRPAGQAAYLEVHVGPGNQQFQLRIPSADLFAAHRDRTEPWRNWVLPAPPCFTSRTRVEPGRWQVEARIPVGAIAEQPVRAGDRWLYSFSRYDYTRGQAQPVLSSTSPHRERNFHRQQEWGVWVIAPDA